MPPVTEIAKTQVLGGITVVDSPLVRRAMELARPNPSRSSSTTRSAPGSSRSGSGSCRTRLTTRKSSPSAALFHDLGLTNSVTGPRRFEIEGADAARAFARERA